jgi:hypothetical protein
MRLTAGDVIRKAIAFYVSRQDLRRDYPPPAKRRPTRR